jgi:hypothetical protein
MAPKSLGPEGPAQELLDGLPEGENLVYERDRLGVLVAKIA